MCVCLSAEVKKESEEGDEPRAETESDSEEELSCFAPTVRAAFSHTAHRATGKGDDMRYDEISQGSA